MMSETHPIQCLSCGVTAFADIRVNTVGVMTLTCFHCRQVTHYNVPIAMAEQSWAETHGKAPELAAPVASEPVQPQKAGYKYEAFF